MPRNIHCRCTTGRSGIGRDGQALQVPLVPRQDDTGEGGMDPGTSGPQQVPGQGFGQGPGLVHEDRRLDYPPHHRLQLGTLLAEGEEGELQLSLGDDHVLPRVSNQEEAGLGECLRQEAHW